MAEFTTVPSIFTALARPGPEIGSVVVAVAIAAQLCAVGAAWPAETTVAGRRVVLEGTLSVREVIEENRSTQHERTLEQLRVHTAVSFADWLRFDSTTLGANGGPTMKADRAGVYAWDAVFQDMSPSVDFQEAYFDVLLPSVDLRIGKQKVAWGKLDRTQPNDLINPATYFDPFLDDEDELKLGVPALQASYYLPDAPAVPAESRLTAVWVPRYLPYRFPLAECTVQGNTSLCNTERWFPPAAIPITNFPVPAGIITLPDGSPNPAFNVPLNYQVNNGLLPAWRMSNSEIGLRYSALVRDIDLALYYFHGFDVQPAFNLTATVFGQPDPDPGNPLHVKDLSADTVLSPKFHHIDSWGSDFAYALGSFTVRGEAAFVSGRPLPRDLRGLVTDPRPIAAEVVYALAALARGAGQAPVALPPSYAVRSAMEWGLGADYVYDGYMLLLQVNQTDVLHNDVDLLIRNVDTRLLANLRKSFLSERLQAQLVAVQGIESGYTLLRPTLRYALTDHVATQVGYLFISGSANSLVGQYRRNGEGFVRVEYSI
ncbi:MAG TPA: DUF1302 family protein [Candidatus Margulisiibacteriota bacterium]|nr:DUF1302 family protein [Candidatus Margulisiibacteriota bacterium]